MIKYIQMTIDGIDEDYFTGDRVGPHSYFDSLRAVYASDDPIQREIDAAEAAWVATHTS